MTRNKMTDILVYLEMRVIDEVQMVFKRVLKRGWCLPSHPCSSARHIWKQPWSAGQPVAFNLCGHFSSIIPEVINSDHGPCRL